jgi:hypothetical protein
MPRQSIRRRRVPRFRAGGQIIQIDGQAPVTRPRVIHVGAIGCPVCSKVLRLSEHREPRLPQPQCRIVGAGSAAKGDGLDQLIAVAIEQPHATVWLSFMRADIDEALPVRRNDILRLRVRGQFLWSGSGRGRQRFDRRCALIVKSGQIDYRFNGLPHVRPRGDARIGGKLFRHRRLDHGGGRRGRRRRTGSEHEDATESEERRGVAHGREVYLACEVKGDGSKANEVDVVVGQGGVEPPTAGV